MNLKYNNLKIGAPSFFFSSHISFYGFSKNKNETQNLVLIYSLLILVCMKQKNIPFTNLSNLYKNSTLPSNRASKFLFWLLFLTHSISFSSKNKHQHIHIICKKKKEEEKNSHKELKKSELLILRNKNNNNK